MCNVKRLKRILRIAFILAIASLGSAATAQAPAAWTFSLLPSNGAISGSPGSTIGWGYELSNLSSTDWLFVTDIQADSPFLNSTVDTVPFDYPILAPLSSVSVAYDGTLGLAELTWDKSAPAGFSNTGIFAMNADFYDGDPFNGGNYVEDAGVQTAAYQASVLPAVQAVPEASTATSLSLVLLPLLLIGMRCQLRRKQRS